MAKAMSFRLPETTAEKLAALAERLGLTLTTVLVLAIDRMEREEKCR